VSKATKRHCAGTVQSQGGGVGNDRWVLSRDRKTATEGADCWQIVPDARSSYIVSICCTWTTVALHGRLQSTMRLILEVRSTRTTFGHQSFAVDGPRVWNSLPASIRDPTLPPFLIDLRLISSFNSRRVCDSEQRPI